MGRHYRLLSRAPNCLRPALVDVCVCVCVCVYMLACISADQHWYIVERYESILESEVLLRHYIESDDESASLHG